MGSGDLAKEGTLVRKDSNRGPIRDGFSKEGYDRDGRLIWRDGQGDRTDEAEGRNRQCGGMGKEGDGVKQIADEVLMLQPAKLGSGGKMLPPAGP